MQSRYTDVDGVRVHHRAAGAGAPLAFVHGLAVSSTYFVPLAEALSSTYACAAVDLPGFGRSGEPGRVLDIPELADALAAWLVSAGLTGAPLVANSAGCQVAVECAVRHADIVGPLVLIGPTVDPAARSALRQVGRLLTTGLTLDAVQTPLLLRDSAAAGARRIVSTTQFMLRHRIEQALPLVAQPTLVVRGAWDPICPQRWALEATDLLPHGWFTVVAGAAHLVHLTHTSEAAAIVRRFLTAAERSAA